MHHRKNDKTQLYSTLKSNFSEEFGHDNLLEEVEKLSVYDDDIDHSDCKILFIPNKTSPEVDK